jgi:hypothetical protein
MKGKGFGSVTCEFFQTRLLGSICSEQRIFLTAPTGRRSYLLLSSTTEGSKAIILLRQSVDASCHGNQRLRPWMQPSPGRDFWWKLQVKRGLRIRGDERVAEGVKWCGGREECMCLNRRGNVRPVQTSHVIVGMPYLQWKYEITSNWK